MKELLYRLTHMCDEAYYVIRSSIILTGVLLFCCLILFLAAGKLSPDTYKLYCLADELFRLPQALLFIAAIGSAILEENASKDS
jgi:hypothetical protein